MGGTTEGTGGRVRWAETLDGALASLLGKPTAAAPPTPEGLPGLEAPPQGAADVGALVEKALKHSDRAEERLRQGEEELRSLRETLKRIQQSEGAAAPAGAP